MTEQLRGDDKQSCAFTEVQTPKQKEKTRETVLLHSLLSNMSADLSLSL